MALGDLFRPRHKHSKSQIRAAAVAAMDGDDLELLLEVACGDRDADIRKQAMAKIRDPETLAKIATEQNDRALQDFAHGRAVDMWISSALGADSFEVGERLLALALKHGGERAAAEVAGGAQLAALRAAALTKLSNDRALGQVVRSSQRAEEWQAALSRIRDTSVLRAIAIDDQRKPVASAALEAIDDLEVLEEIAGKAKNKSVRTRAKRLRARLVKESAPATPGTDQDRRAHAERAQLARELEKLAKTDEWIQSRADVDARVARWHEVSGGHDAALTERFEKAVARYEAAYERVGKAAAEQTRRAEERAREVEVRAEAETRPPVLVPTREEPEAEAVSTRRAPVKDDDSRRASDEERLSNQDAFEDLCEQLELLVQSDRIKGFEGTLKDCDRRRRELGPLPKDTAKELADRFDEARRRAVIRLGELREAEDWRRWNNVGKMEKLIERAKALLESQEPQPRLGNDLKALQSEWRDLGAAPREKADELWARFKETCDSIYEKVKSSRAERSEVQKVNLDKKTALCERAEELSKSTDWEATAQAIKELQAEWKATGPVQRRQGDKLWKRFRAACDAFFEARKPHLDERHAEENENLEAKEAILKELEALVQAEGDVEEQIAAAKALQRDWRDTGRVARGNFETLNERYQVACDAIFGKRAAMETARLEAERAIVAELKAQITAVADAGWDADATELAKQVLTIRTRFFELDPSVEGHDDLGKSVDEICRRQVESEPSSFAGSELDPERSRERREKLISRIEELAPEASAGSQSQSADEMAEKLRAALQENALGGAFSKTGGRPMSEVVAELRASWNRLGPVPGAAGAELDRRFTAACERALQQAAS